MPEDPTGNVVMPEHSQAIRRPLSEWWPDRRVRHEPQSEGTVANWKVTTRNGEWVNVKASRITLCDDYVVMRAEGGGVRGVFYRPVTVKKVEGDA